VNLRTLSRTAVLLAIVVAPLVAQQGGSLSEYSHRATLPSTVGGRVLGSFQFDASANRLYAASDRGLFWVDLTETRPIFKGPMFKENIRRIEFAPELGRIFFFTFEGVGYVDTASLSEPHMFVRMQAEDLTYEPSRRELYVTARERRVRVFDAKTGEAGAVIDVPGWYATQLEAMPGKVFLTVAGEQPLYAIDAATHKVSAFPIGGKFTTPAHMEADPAGRYLFLSYYQNIMALDAKTGRVIGRVNAPFTPSIAFDPGSNLLIATWENDPPPTRISTYRVEDSGLSLVSELRNPGVGMSGIEPTSKGFIQRGRLSLLVWAFTGPAELISSR
jgi:hypothetical protein